VVGKTQKAIRKIEERIRRITMTTKVDDLIKKIQSDVEELYDSINPVDIELRKKVWDIWMKFIDIIPEEEDQ
jgi:midasin (ATPase involved in ribosome maturation)